MHIFFWLKGVTTDGQNGQRLNAHAQRRSGISEPEPEYRRFQEERKRDT